MNENIDLTKILKDCPKGFKLYSLLHGEVSFRGIDETNDYPITYDYLIRSNIGICSSAFYLTRNGTYSNNYNGNCILFPSKDQRDWSKFTAPWYKEEEEKLVKPKFKVGDKVKRKGTNKDNVYEITKVYDESYGIADLSLVIYIKYQDQYELVHNKFDPKTLKPFDKVLVQQYDIWYPDFYSCYIENDDSHVCCSGLKDYYLCIPYNDDTKHLAGTKDEAPEYYRYWED